MARRATRVRPEGLAGQPISRVEWVDGTLLRRNAWNPNVQAAPEHRLLKISILEDGITQPIVVHEMPDGTLEIIDGFHRSLVFAMPDVQNALGLGGLVPVVKIAPDAASARMATIRHNRARGTHHVVKMADIVAELHDLGVSDAEIGQRLGMEPEEVRRLLDRGQLVKTAQSGTLGRAWNPAPQHQSKRGQM